MIFRTAVIPVVVEDGVTSLSTLTHSFTVTNSLTIEPTASFDPEHTAATTADTSFIDIDRDFDSQVCLCIIINLLGRTLTYLAYLELCFET